MCQSLHKGIKSSDFWAYFYVAVLVGRVMKCLTTSVRVVGKVIVSRLESRRGARGYDISNVGATEAFGKIQVKQMMFNNL